MSPVEIMTSESQERMLAIVEPASLEQVVEICEQFEIRASVVGRVVAAPSDGSPGVLRVRAGADGEILGEIPARSLADGAPRYRRPLAPPAGLEHSPPARARCTPCRAKILARTCSSSATTRPSSSASTTISSS